MHSVILCRVVQWNMRHTKWKTTSLRTQHIYIHLRTPHLTFLMFLCCWDIVCCWVFVCLLLGFCLFVWVHFVCLFLVCLFVLFCFVFCSVLFCFCFLGVNCLFNRLLRPEIHYCVLMEPNMNRMQKAIKAYNHAGRVIYENGNSYEAVNMKSRYMMNKATQVYSNCLFCFVLFCSVLFFTLWLFTQSLEIIYVSAWKYVMKNHPMCVKNLEASYEYSLHYICTRCFMSSSCNKNWFSMLSRRPSTFACIIVCHIPYVLGQVYDSFYGLNEYSKFHTKCIMFV